MELFFPQTITALGEISFGASFTLNRGSRLDHLASVFSFLNMFDPVFSHCSFIFDKHYRLCSDEWQLDFSLFTS